jgi:hypothetical protein
VAEKASHTATSSSKLQQAQLHGLSNILSMCRVYFTKRAGFRLVSRHFAAWSCFASVKILLKRRTARFVSKHSRVRLLDSFWNWSTAIIERKQQDAQSTIAVLQQQQLQRSKNALEHCRLFFSNRAHLQDDASLLRHAFAEWLQRARTLRRAAAVAKKFLFRCLNQQLSRAFFCWAQTLLVRLQNLKVAKMTAAAHLACVHNAFAGWCEVTRIQKAAQEVCAAHALSPSLPHSKTLFAAGCARPARA